MGDITLGISTDVDKYMKMCAQIKYNCALKRMKGVCRHCSSSCSTYKNTMSYINRLAPVEQEYVDTMVQTMLNNTSTYEMRSDSATKNGLRGIRLFASLIKIAIIMGVIAFTIPVIGFWLCRPHDKAPSANEFVFVPERVYDDYLDACIRDTLRQTYKLIYDLDGDGRIDCVDYSVAFHVLWYKKYGYNGVCYLTVNQFSPTGMNHMFITIIYGGREYHIEPQRHESAYIMEKVWGSKYDSRYDKYPSYHYWYQVCRIE